MQELLNTTIKKIKEERLKTTKEWNRYAVEHKLLSAETIMYFTNQKYQNIIENQHSLI